MFLPPAPTNPPQDITVTVTGVAATLTWNPPPDTVGLLSYTLSCWVDGTELVRVVVKPIQEFTLEELIPATSYACTLLASTSGGNGPSAPFIIATEGLSLLFT